MVANPSGLGRFNCIYQTRSARLLPRLVAVALLMLSGGVDNVHLAV